MAPFEPSNQADFLVSVDELGLFAGLDAIEVSGQSTPVYDGGSLEAYILGGRSAPGEFGLTRPFSRDREMPLYRRFLPLVNAVYLNVMIYPTDRQLQRSGSYFQGRALLTSMSLPAMDAGTQQTPAPPMLAVKMRAAKWSVV